MGYVYVAIGLSGLLLLLGCTGRGDVLTVGGGFGSNSVSDRNATDRSSESDPFDLFFFGRSGMGRQPHSRRGRHPWVNFSGSVSAAERRTNLSPAGDADWIRVHTAVMV